MPITDAATWPVELTLLLWSVALCVAQMLIHAVGASLQVGLPMLAGNRQDMPALGGWAGRAQRAHRNLLENLPLFAILVLLAAITNGFTATTALGAQLFFWARVAYAAAYLAGIPYLRTLIWLVSMVGLVLIFIELV
jgi:uncharacterized MAPEG superfamily protein